MSQPSDQPGYRADIDGLRALAVTAVVGYHAFPGWVRGGYVGVDVFFVISGFLIGGIVKNDLLAGTFSFARFYARRVRRIFPALALVLAATLFLGWFALFSYEYKDLGSQVFSGGFFAANFLFWRRSDYFDIDSAAKPLLHLWSLSVEEQFYLCLPLLLFIAHKKRLRAAALAGLVLVVSFAFNLAWYKNYQTAAFYSPLTRFWELMLGVIAALRDGDWGHWGSRAGEGWRNNLREASVWLGLAILAATIFISPEKPHYPGWRALGPTLSALLIIVGRSGGFAGRRLLGNRLTVGLGLISYPLYLWHWPLLSFARIVNGGAPGPLSRLAAVALALALAWGTWRFVERPIRFGRRFGAFRNMAPLTAVFILAFCGLYAWFNAGLPGGRYRPEYDPKMLPLFNWEIVTPGDSCKKYAPGLDLSWVRCRYHDAGAGETIVLLGDSHAEAAYPGVAADSAYNTLMLVKHSSERPVHGFDETVPETLRDTWRTQVAGIFDFIEGRADITKVFIINMDSYYAKSEPYKSALKTGYQAAIDRLREAGKEVFIVLENPMFQLPQSESRLVDHVERPWGWEPKKPWPSLTKAEVLEWQREYREIMQDVLNATIIDTVPVLCPQDECLFLFEGLPLYADKTHLNPHGSHFQAEHILSPHILPNIPQATEKPAEGAND